MPARAWCEPSAQKPYDGGVTARGALGGVADDAGGRPAGTVAGLGGLWNAGACPIIAPRMKMHDGEVDIDAELVGRLVAAQFPELTDLPIKQVESTGTVNAIYRLGDHLQARLPRVQEWAQDLDKEWYWLPKLAPRLSLRVPRAGWEGPPCELVPLLLGDLRVDRRPAVFG
jgi:hypothetical protein